MSALHFDRPRLWCALLLGLAVFGLGCPSPNPVAPDLTCARDTDCPAGQSCAAGLCKPCPSCAAGEVCIAATCLPAACGDAACPAGQGCWEGRCVGSECFQVSCPEGQACASGACHPLDCPGEDCRPGEFCVDGRCATPSCFGVTCPAGESCANGACLPQTCGGVTCAPGRVCQGGQCVDTRCVGVLCAADATCVAGMCHPNHCGGIACAEGEACVAGVCQDARCVAVQCPLGLSCEAGACVPCPGGTCCTTPEPCGVNGACERPCEAGGLGACQPKTGPVDLQTDVAHCGTCGNACPIPAHAEARCVAGACGRGPCEPGYFDLDGPASLGCEATCDGGQCSLPDGGAITIHSVLLPETGLLPRGMAAGASVGGQIQTSAQNTNQSVLGEGIPLSGTGATEQTGAAYRNQGGFVPALR